jgi:hypothetical protein
MMWCILGSPSAALSQVHEKVNFDLNSSSVLIQYYGREPGSQIYIQQPGTAIFRNGKPRRWSTPLVNKHIEAGPFSKLLNATREMIHSFPCEGYKRIPDSKVSDPGHYTISYTHNHVSEAVTFQAIDASDRALMTKNDEMLKSLKMCFPSCPHMLSIERETIINPFGLSNIVMVKCRAEDNACNTLGYLERTTSCRIDIFRVEDAADEGRIGKKYDSKLGVKRPLYSALDELEKVSKNQRDNCLRHFKRILAILLQRSSEKLVIGPERFAVTFESASRNIRIGFTSVQRNDDELSNELVPLLKILNRDLPASVSWHMSLDDFFRDE